MEKGKGPGPRASSYNEGTPHANELEKAGAGAGVSPIRGPDSSGDGSLLYGFSLNNRLMETESL